MKNVKFTKFLVSDIFEIMSSNGIFHSINVDLYDKKIENSHPYVVRTSQNNGVKGYIIQDEKCLNPGNTISFAQDTAQIFYQSEDYFTGNKIKIFKLKNHEMTEEIALFLISCLNKAFINFKWGSSYDSKILANVEISCPSETGITPDFEYMESFIRELEQERMSELEQYLLITGLNDYELTEKDKEILTINPSLYEFKIENIFDVNSSKKKFNACNVKIKENGEYPYVVRTSQNNGIKGYIDEDINFLNDGNTISFGQDTATMFYQEKPYFTGDKIKILTLKKHVLNSQIANYLICNMRKAFSMFSWGVSSFDEKVIRSVKIYLPVQTDENNNPIMDTNKYYHPDGYIPDFDYMESYIKVQEKLAIKDVVLLKDKIIEETRKIINT